MYICVGVILSLYFKTTKLRGSPQEPSAVRGWGDRVTRVFEVQGQV